ncbi:MAG: ATP-binding cassette domain-containing protein [Spirochaetia bacterium]|nr:ATP-binding cassette domain-containing protein [Spirochaetia bacterium]
MISTSSITLKYGERVLFKDVNLKFSPGNCYGLIGANGSGKSTFLKILSGEIEPTEGVVTITPGERMAVLKQNHFEFDEYSVMHTVIMGHKKLYDVMMEKDAIYAKENFTEEDGIRASALESDFADMNGWEAEPEAATLLAGLGIPEEMHEMKMKDLAGGDKVRVLLAQALFGNPDILLLDEPTNHLDLESINWLEDFLSHFSNTVIVVSHDRHFLNTVCTHIADIDFSQIKLYAGNYDFWYMASQLAAKQRKDEKKKREDKIAELKEFIQRFASNASKSKQATSRKKIIDKLSLEEMPATSRKFPYVSFKPERECGRNILDIKGISKTIDGVQVLKDFSLQVQNGDKIAFVGPNHMAKTVLFQIISGEMEPDSGSYEWGITISHAYYPKDNSKFFEDKISLVDWLSQYTTSDDESYIRGFLGRMLFTGDEALKMVNVLSGGEKVRCMLSKMMLSGANTLIFDEPTNHLDLESIQSLNTGLTDFTGVILMNTHDHQFADTVANRIIEFCPDFKIIDKRMGFDEYLLSDDVKALRDSMYNNEHQRLSI